jgi:hypothetical protein
VRPASVRVHHRLIPRRGSGLLPVCSFGRTVHGPAAPRPTLHAMLQLVFSRGASLLPVCLPDVALHLPARFTAFSSVPNRITLLGPLSLHTLLDFRPQRYFALSRFQPKPPQTPASSLRSIRFLRSRGDVPRPRSSPPLPFANPLPCRTRVATDRLRSSPLRSTLPAVRSRDAPGTTCSTGRLTRR